MKILTILSKEELEKIQNLNLREMIIKNSIEVPEKVNLTDIRKNIVETIDESLEAEYEEALERLGM